MPRIKQRFRDDATPLGEEILEFADANNKSLVDVAKKLGTDHHTIYRAVASPSPLDTFAVPPGVCRGFRNISEEEGILQVLITGGIHDMQDIAFPPGVADELDSVQSGLADFFRSTGLTFNAGLE